MELGEMQSAPAVAAEPTEIEKRATFISAMKFLYLLITLIKDWCEQDEKNEATPDVICKKILQNLTSLYKRNKKKFSVYIYILNEVWESVIANKDHPVWVGLSLVIKTCDEMRTHILEKCKQMDIDLIEEIHNNFITGTNIFDMEK